MKLETPYYRASFTVIERIPTLFSNNPPLDLERPANPLPQEISTLSVSEGDSPNMRVYSTANLPSSQKSLASAICFTK